MSFYAIRPLGPWISSKSRRYSPFRASWTDTLTVLEKELYELRAKNTYLHVDVPEGQIRQDGQLRADARVLKDAVRISFDSKHGPLTYATDAFYGWQANVRAIALGLEALRKIDRYGVTKAGEQYKGWRQLEAASTALSTMDQRSAAEILEYHAIGDEGDARERTIAQLVEGTHPDAKEIWRQARRDAHPDNNDGNQTHWDRVEMAAKVLGIS